MNLSRSDMLDSSTVKKDENTGKWQLTLPSGEVGNILYGKDTTICNCISGHEHILFDICLFR